jgi:hypothetical protein
VIVSQACRLQVELVVLRVAALRSAPVWAETGGSCNMAEEVLDANAAQRRYWNTVAGPRWVAAPGLLTEPIGPKNLRMCLNPDF